MDDEFPVEDGWASCSVVHSRQRTAETDQAGGGTTGCGASAAKTSVHDDIAAASTSVPEPSPVEVNNDRNTVDSYTPSSDRGGRFLIFPGHASASPSYKSPAPEQSRAAAPNGASAPARMEYVKAPYRAATSPTAKRTYLSTFLLFVASTVLLGIAAVAYPVFYYNYVPKKVISVPVHLQYNVGLNPYAIVTLASDLMTEQAYDVTVDLTLPRSPANLGRGNFMIALYALKSTPEDPALFPSLPSSSTSFPDNFITGNSNGGSSDPYSHVTHANTIFASRRPVLLPYADPLVSTAHRLLWLLWHVLSPSGSARAQTEALQVAMGALAVGAAPPRALLLDVQAGQDLQVYACRVRLVARLDGLRWLMYHHRVLAFAGGTLAFWAVEMAALAFAWAVLACCFRAPAKSRKPKTIKQEGEEESDPDRLKMRVDQAGLRRLTDGGADLDGSVKQEEEDDEDDEEYDDAELEDVSVKKEESTEHETLVNVPRARHAAADADDEEEIAEDGWKETASGSSYHDTKGGLLRRRSSKGGKI